MTRYADSRSWKQVVPQKWGCHWSTKDSTLGNAPLQTQGFCCVGNEPGVVFTQGSIITNSCPSVLPLFAPPLRAQGPGPRHAIQVGLTLITWSSNMTLMNTTSYRHKRKVARPDGHFAACRGIRNLQCMGSQPFRARGLHSHSPIDTLSCRFINEDNTVYIMAIYQ